MNLVCHVGADGPGLARLAVGQTSRACFCGDTILPGNHLSLKKKIESQGANKTGSNDSAQRWPWTPSSMATVGLSVGWLGEN